MRVGLFICSSLLYSSFTMITIGSLSLPNRLILAPLAGYSNLPFRILCREYGAGLCVTEMISCHGLVYNQTNTLRLLESCCSERPVSFQLFGSDPAVMGEAAARLFSYKPDIIDINMGCPVKKVTKRGAGAALMTDIVLAEKIIQAVIASACCPVTVKLRSGPDLQTINVKEFAEMSEAQGVSAVTVHGRTWSQGFSGAADWQIIAEVKQTISIPVIGNGDICTHSEAMQRITQSGCDAVMIGRAALGNPWVFSPGDKPKTLQGVLKGAYRHLSLIEKHTENGLPALAPVKNHLGRYFKGLRGSSAIRRSIYETQNWQSLKGLLHSISQESTT